MINWIPYPFNEKVNSISCPQISIIYSPKIVLYNRCFISSISSMIPCKLDYLNFLLLATFRCQNNLLSFTNWFL